MKQLHLDQSENFNFSSYNYKIKSTLSLAKCNNHECREFSQDKPSISFFTPKPRGCRLPFSKKLFFPAGALLLCLILAKVCGHSLAKPADKVLAIFIFQHETQNIQSFRQRNKTHRLTRKQIWCTRHQTTQRGQRTSAVGARGKKAGHLLNFSLPLGEFQNPFSSILFYYYKPCFCRLMQLPSADICLII